MEHDGYLVLTQGQEMWLDFPVEPEALAEAKSIQFAVTGYYEIAENATGLQGIIRNLRTEAAANESRIKTLETERTAIEATLTRIEADVAVLKTVEEEKDPTPIKEETR